MPTDRRNVVGLILSLAVSVALGPAPAAAQPDEPGQEEAVRLFQQSVDEYRAGRFQNAVDLLRRAHELHPEPTLLYNLGRALEGLGDEQGAIDGYSRYLEAVPNATDRGAIEHRIETLRERLREREALAAERDRERDHQAQQERVQVEREPRDEAPRSSGPGALPWIVAATGGAAVAAGGILGVLAQGQVDDADGGTTQQDVWDQYQTARSTATAANVCFIAGGVVAAVGLAWGIVGSLGSGRADREVDDDEVRTAGPRVAWVPPGGIIVQW